MRSHSIGVAAVSETDRELPIARPSLQLAVLRLKKFNVLYKHNRAVQSKQNN